MWGFFAFWIGFLGSKQLSSDFGKGFVRKELTATLTACDASFSYSDPLVIRVLPFLKSFRQSRPSFPVFPDRGFAVIVFHELLLLWLVENFDFEKSLLYLKYKAQGGTQVVLNHLHLMATQKKIYGELGGAEELKFMDWYYSGIKDPAYPRAWAIVNSIEGVPAFIDEVSEPESFASTVGSECS